jgi:hypothetical protein
VISTETILKTFAFIFPPGIICVYREPTVCNCGEKAHFVPLGFVYQKAADNPYW